MQHEGEFSITTPLKLFWTTKQHMDEHFILQQHECLVNDGPSNFSCF